MKYSLWLSVLLMVLFITPQKASAHFLAVAHSISGYLHIVPNDDPTVGEHATIYFDIHDDKNKFALQQCDCLVEIQENNKTIFSQPLQKNTSNKTVGTGFVSYVFPKKDVYIIKLVGKPHEKDAFEPFTLNWDFEVNQAAAVKSQQTGTLPLPYLALFGIMLVAIIGYCIKRFS